MTVIAIGNHPAGYKGKNNIVGVGGPTQITGIGSASFSGDVGDEFIIYPYEWHPDPNQGIFFQSTGSAQFCVSLHNRGELEVEDHPSQWDDPIDLVARKVTRAEVTCIGVKLIFTTKCLIYVAIK